MTRANEPSLPQLETSLPEWARCRPLHTISAKPNNVCVPHTNLLTLADAANQLRISPRTVRRMVKCGKLTVIRIGRQLRFDRDTLWSEINDLGSRRE